MQMARELCGCSKSNEKNMTDIKAVVLPLSGEAEKLVCGRAAQSDSARRAYEHSVAHVSQTM
jgi:hypothetical protein